MVTAAGLMVFAGLPVSARAAAIPLGGGGILLISNSAGGVVGITSTPNRCIAFSGSSTCAGAVTGIHNSGIDPIFGTTGTIKDVGTATPVPAFLTANLTIGGGPAIWDLTSLITTAAGAGNCLSNLPLNTCTPVNSPFTLTMDATGKQVTISFAVLLNGYLGSSVTGTTPYRGIFSTTLSGAALGTFGCANVDTNITNLLACEAAGGTIKGTWSASIAPVTASPTPIPPTVTCAASPNSLWPPNGKADTVTVTGLVTPGSQLIGPGGTTYSVTDEYGQVQPSGSFTPNGGGAFGFAVPLIAARNGNDLDGRTYTIHVSVTDLGGQTGSCTAVVKVPHDQGH
jgi:hypothetical protein